MSTLLTRLTRRALSLGLHCPGSRPLARRLRSGAAAIVMYHGVTAEALPVANWCQLAAAEFACQIEFLTRHYTILPLREVVSRLKQRLPLPDRPAVLTFDDGFRNVFTTAFPVLQHHQVPATVFLVTGLVGTRQPAWPERLFHALVTTRLAALKWHGSLWDLATPGGKEDAYRGLTARLKLLATPDREERFEGLLADLGGCPPIAPDSPLATLDWSEAAEMARSGLIDFGSHTHTHPVLSRCSVAVQREELRCSRDLLREHLGRADLFAYPNGSRADFTIDTRRLLADLGYCCGVSTIEGLNRRNADLYALKRVHVGADTTLAQFELRLLGL
jgi:peptidoglycan/xylan/chitin deacetylase (PgdA/CDA1 family)